MKILIAPIMALLFISGSSFAADLQAGKLKAQQMCQTCHGMDGQATLPMTANLSGQREDYMVIQLEQFRSGRRQHAQMSIIAQSLTDEDIENVAHWYASIRITVTMPE